jgi:SAM-dependent methyltransferase
MDSNIKSSIRPPHVVRGYGPFDILLAKQRCKVASKQIELAGKKGSILDIGCGCYPLFLMGINFAEKYGLEKNTQPELREELKRKGIILVEGQVAENRPLPFDDDFFDVVSMLAVFEHIEPAKLVNAHKEIYRILKRGGLYVMTTPAFWTDGLLRFLSRIHLISDVEIQEHKGSYSHSAITSILQQAGFQKNKIRFGYFELFMNTWVAAVK